jgi:hypothetical protein
MKTVDDGQETNPGLPRYKKVMLTIQLQDTIQIRSYPQANLNENYTKHLNMITTLNVCSGSLTYQVNSRAALL